jgi:hypothetical protein
MYATLVNLITADKISVSNWPTDKQQPGLKLTTHFPRLAQPYWVSMADSGSTARGASDRTYHCRWLVSGHWRHYRTGDKTWIRAYVKGPKGAPWKGRPVHLLRKAGVA